MNERQAQTPWWNHVESSDSAVIAAVLAGQEAQFEVLMRRHNQRVFRITRAIVADDAEAEDVLQQAYVLAFGRLAQLRDGSSFSSWLTQIAVREARARAAKRVRQERRLSLVVDSNAERPPEAPVSPEEAADRGRLRTIIRRAVDQLPPDYRHVFVLRDIQELSTRETSETLGLAEETVRVRLHRARRKLRDHLEEAVGPHLHEVYGFAGHRCHRIVSNVFTQLGLSRKQ